MSYHNPALRSYPRKQHAVVIPLHRNGSILEWLEQSGRMIETALAPDFPTKGEDAIHLLLGNSDSYEEKEKDDDASLTMDD